MSALINVYVSVWVPTGSPLHEYVCEHVAVQVWMPDESSMLVDFAIDADRKKYWPSPRLP